MFLLLLHITHLLVVVCRLFTLLQPLLSSVNILGLFRFCFAPPFLFLFICCLFCWCRFLCLFYSSVCLFFSSSSYSLRLLSLSLSCSLLCLFVLLSSLLLSLSGLSDSLLLRFLRPLFVPYSSRSLCCTHFCLCDCPPLEILSPVLRLVCSSFIRLFLSFVAVLSCVCIFLKASISASICPSGLIIFFPLPVVLFASSMFVPIYSVLRSLSLFLPSFIAFQLVLPCRHACSSSVW